MLTVPSSVTSPFCHVGCAEVSVVDVVVSLSLTEDEAVVVSVVVSSDDSVAEVSVEMVVASVVVETVEPVSLSAKLVEPDRCNCCCDCDDDTPATLSTTGSADFFPENICSCFDDDLVISDNVRHVVVSYGLFSIIRLERDTQLLIDAVDFCIPTQECPSATEGNPCNLFNDIRFPIDEFFPPQRSSADDNNHRCGCGCSGNSGTARESRCNCGN